MNAKKTFEAIVIATASIRHLAPVLTISVHFALLGFSSGAFAGALNPTCGDQFQNQRIDARVQQVIDLDLGSARSVPRREVEEALTPLATVSTEWVAREIPRAGATTASLVATGPAPGPAQTLGPIAKGQLIIATRPSIINPGGRDLFAGYVLEPSEEPPIAHAGGSLLTAIGLDGAIHQEYLHQLSSLRTTEGAGTEMMFVAPHAGPGEREHLAAQLSTLEAVADIVNADPSDRRLTERTISLVSSATEGWTDIERPERLNFGPIRSAMIKVQDRVVAGVYEWTRGNDQPVVFSGRVIDVLSGGSRLGGRKLLVFTSKGKLIRVEIARLRGLRVK